MRFCAWQVMPSCNSQIFQRLYRVVRSRIDTREVSVGASPWSFYRPAPLGLVHAGVVSSSSCVRMVRTRGRRLRNGSTQAVLPSVVPAARIRAPECRERHNHLCRCHRIVGRRGVSTDRPHVRGPMCGRRRRDCRAGRCVRRRTHATVRRTPGQSKRRRTVAIGPTEASWFVDSDTSDQGVDNGVDRANGATPNEGDPWLSGTNSSRRPKS